MPLEPSHRLPTESKRPQMEKFPALHLWSFWIYGSPVVSKRDSDRISTLVRVALRS